jgi:uncharacterized protein
MPLLISPIDGQTPMQQLIRDGIEIDRCPVSGGVWLDRGELEKLLNAVHTAVSADRQEYAAYQQTHHYRDDDDYDRYYHHKYGKKSKLRSIFDLFD